MVSTCDAHIHVGYFDRRGLDAPFYYSPRRICTVMKKCGVGEFIYSSTSMQAHGVVFEDVHREMREVKKLFGIGAHPFLWITREYLKTDPNLSALDHGFYEGIKLHGLETDWLNAFPDKLEQVLAIADRKRLPVMVHTCAIESSRPLKWLKYAQGHEKINFNFAHGSPVEEAATCLRKTKNVYVDTSCMTAKDVTALLATGCGDRVLWGTDFPALPARAGDSRLTDAYRKLVKASGETAVWKSRTAFRRFLGTEQLDFLSAPERPVRE